MNEEIFIKERLNKKGISFDDKLIMFILEIYDEAYRKGLEQSPKANSISLIECKKLIRAAYNKGIENSLVLMRSLNSCNSSIDDNVNFYNSRIKIIKDALIKLKK